MAGAAGLSEHAVAGADVAVEAAERPRREEQARGGLEDEAGLPQGALRPGTAAGDAGADLGRPDRLESREGVGRDGVDVGFRAWRLPDRPSRPCAASRRPPAGRRAAGASRAGRRRRGSTGGRRSVDPLAAASISRSSGIDAVVSGSASRLPSRGGGRPGRGCPPISTSTSRGSRPRRAYRVLEMGCNESVTVARTAPGGAPVAASSNSRPPTPRPCASGSTKRLLRNHHSPLAARYPRRRSAGRSLRASLPRRRRAPRRRPRRPRSARRRAAGSVGRPGTGRPPRGFQAARPARDTR